MLVKEVGFGIVGLGNIAPAHAESISAIEGARLVAVCARKKDKAQAFADKYGGTPYTNYKKLLEDEDVDAVALCVPSGLRADMAGDIARAGKHIMAEKPLEITAGRVDRIIHACERHNVLLGCIFQNRFADGPRHVRRALDEHRFGKLVLGDAYIKWYRSQEYYDSGEWRGTWSLDGGGALMNQGIHQIDLLLWFLGDVASVRARMDTVAHKRIQVEDIATAMLEFKNGAQGIIEGSTAIYPGHPARVEVHGTEGSAVLEDGKLTFWEFARPEPVDEEIEASLHSESELGSGAADPLAKLKIEGHRRQYQDFVDAIRTGRHPIIDGREGRRAVELIEAIYKSARTERTVRL